MTHEHISTNAQRHKAHPVYGKPREGDLERLANVRDYVDTDTNRESVSRMNSRLKEVMEYTAEALGKARIIRSGP